MSLLPLNAMMLTFVIATSLHYFMVLPSNCVSFQARKVLPSNCVFSFKLEIMYLSLPSFLSLFSLFLSSIYLLKNWRIWALSPVEFPIAWISDSLCSSACFPCLICLIFCKLAAESRGPIKLRFNAIDRTTGCAVTFCQEAHGAWFSLFWSPVNDTECQDLLIDWVLEKPNILILSWCFYCWF